MNEGNYSGSRRTRKKTAVVLWEALVIVLIMHAKQLTKFKCIKEAFRSINDALFFVARAGTFFAQRYLNHNAANSTTGSIGYIFDKIAMYRRKFVNDL